MKPTGTTSSGAASLAVVFAFGAPGGGAFILLSWWLLTLVADPATADEWWEYALVVAYSWRRCGRLSLPASLPCAWPRVSAG